MRDGAFVIVSAVMIDDKPVMSKRSSSTGKAIGRSQRDQSGNINCGGMWTQTPYYF